MSYKLSTPRSSAVSPKGLQGPSFNKVLGLGYRVGDTVRVTGYSSPAVVRYIGSMLSFDPNEIWLGMEFDQPVGKCDGKVRVTKDGNTIEKRYFTCQQNHGCFMKASNKSLSKVMSASRRQSTTSNGTNSRTLFDSPRSDNARGYDSATEVLSHSSQNEISPDRALFNQRSPITDQAQIIAEKVPFTQSSPLPATYTRPDDGTRARIEGLERAIQKTLSAEANHTLAVEQLTKRVDTLEGFMVEVSSKLTTLQDVLDKTVLEDSAVITSQSIQIKLLKKSLSDIVTYTKAAQIALKRSSD